MKGSYTHTTSKHRFDHHTVDTLSDNLYCSQQLNILLFLRLTCQTSINARFVRTCIRIFNLLCWLLNKGDQTVRSQTAWRCDYLLILLLLGYFQHQWIHNTSVTTQRVFSLPFCGSLPLLTNHFYVITCGTSKKLSKMVSNLASKALKRICIELRTLYTVTIDRWRIS